MDWYLVVPLLSCLCSTVVASRTWLREPDNVQMRPIAALSALGAGWAFCEVMWHQADSAGTALFWARLSCVATFPIGPVALHALAVAGDADTPRLRRSVQLLLLASLPLVALGVTTGAVIDHMVPTWFGWSPATGPWLWVHYGLSGACVVVGFLVFRARVPLGPESELSPLVTASIAIPLVLVSLTDVVLPSLGFHLAPRLGVASLAFVGAMQTFVVYRDGEHSLLPEGVTGAVLRALPDGVVSVTLDGLVRSANDRFADLVGVSTGELIGRSIRRHLPASLVDEARERNDVECTLVDAAGRPVDVAVSSSVRERRGRPTGLVFIVRDVREVSALRQRLLLSGRMAAVGELAAGIAHELNNPLAYLKSNLSTLRNHSERFAKELGELSHSPELEELSADCEAIIDESLEGVDRASSIVSDVREFSHAGGREMRPTALRAVIEQSARVARLQIRQGVELSISADDLPSIEANGQRLTQVFVNLLVNAGQAVEEYGHIGVAASMRSDQVEIRVRDDGRGIPEADLERIFDPFFTTKPVGVGTGLGLAIAFGIVQEHGGTIGVTSTAGQGTEFTVRLPLRHAD